MIRHFVFDLDGTLVDSLPGISWSVLGAIEKCGMRPLTTDLRPLIGPPVRDTIAATVGISDVVELDRLEKTFRESYDVDGWKKTIVHDGTHAMLEALATRGARLSVVTNKPAVSTNLILEHFGLRPHFSEVLARDSRTKAERLIAVTEDRETTLMVGDTIDDCLAARAAGVECVIVAHGYGMGLGEELPAGSKRISNWLELLDLAR